MRRFQYLLQSCRHCIALPFVHDRGGDILGHLKYAQDLSLSVANRHVGVVPVHLLLHAVYGEGKRDFLETDDLALVEDCLELRFDDVPKFLPDDFGGLAQARRVPAGVDGQKAVVVNPDEVRAQKRRLGKGEQRIWLTAEVSSQGQVAMAPSAVVSQGKARIRSHISPVPKMGMALVVCVSVKCSKDSEFRIAILLTTDGMNFYPPWVAKTAGNVAATRIE